MSTFPFRRLSFVGVVVTVSLTGMARAQDAGESAPAPAAEGAAATPSPAAEDASATPPTPPAESEAPGQSSTVEDLAQSSRAKLAGAQVLAGAGRIMPSGAQKDYVDAGWQWGLQLNRPLMNLTDSLALTGAFDFRYAKLSKDLKPVRPGAASAQATAKRFDYSLLVGLRHGLGEHYGLFADVGPSAQVRSLRFTSDTGGDFANGLAFGYALRLGAQYQRDLSFGRLVMNLFFARHAGAKRESGRLKYDLRKVDYNGPAHVVGLELGTAL